MTTEQTSDSINPEVIETMATELFENKSTIAALRGLGEDELEAIYALGFNAYRQGKYHDAAQTFSMLSVYNHFEPKYHKGLAASCQMMQMFPEAIQAYGAALAIAPLDVEPKLHIAECLIAIGEIDDAKEMLGYVLEEVEGEEASAIRDRANVLLDALASN
ncbi:SycD/LcrH family type III secretion system chaperone [Thalassospira sp.]|uniref:SycD/LcrH family type III secretion system chaperone n=1 Tax=Thalassospira sp. TaxID=1912094 RepID=UPI000C47185A|nr:SycD/LcrH family type III secretion system chaperone [Thalassospira sp.]MBC05422.1 CesD/SycD/LcrH family type III secretion system chaperone [Thalassospira sp.]|tara:strand:- start:20019 stop:20501 length:483 start_codon:yes stop_codon:yes gene_type:complete